MGMSVSGLNNEQSGETRIGDHTPLPQDVQPYQGLPLECLVVAVPVKMKSKFNAVTSNIDEYYPAISRYLQQGYTLNTFCPLPKSVSMAGLATMETTYEAIFSRPVGVRERQDDAGFTVERSIIHFENNNPFSRDRAADSSDIMKIIIDHTSRGARLIAVENNGHGVTRGINFHMNKGIGVDILFEIPKQPTTAKYVYKVINVPFSVTASMRRQTSYFDWLSTFSSYLKQGWKLVRVFIDGSREGDGWEFTVNSIWFFEKETSKLQDPTPIYEGVIIEYFHKVSMLGSVRTDWSPVILEMGRRGWELACVQESGEMGMAGFAKVKMKLNLFFQRKIVTARSMPHPQYSSRPSFRPGIPPPQYQSRPPSRATTPFDHRRQPPSYPPSQAPSYPPSYHSERFDG